MAWGTQTLTLTNSSTVTILTSSTDATAARYAVQNYVINGGCWSADQTEFYPISAISSIKIS